MTCVCNFGSVLNNSTIFSLPQTILSTSVIFVNTYLVIYVWDSFIHKMWQYVYVIICHFMLFIKVIVVLLTVN